MEATANRREELFLRKALHTVLMERELDLTFKLIRGREYEAVITPRGHQHEKLRFTASVERIPNIEEFQPRFREAEKHGRGTSVVGISACFTPILSEVIEGTEWVGQVLGKEVSLKCEAGTEDDFVSKISDYLRTTGLEKKPTSNLVKAIPVDVYAVWKRLADIAKSDGHKVEVVDAGRPIPELRITDSLGQTFILDTSSPLKISLNDEVIETVSKDSNVDALAYRFRQFFLNQPASARENVALGVNQRGDYGQYHRGADELGFVDGRGKFASLADKRAQAMELFEGTTAFFQIKSHTKEIMDKRGLAFCHHQDALGRDVITFAPIDTAYAPLTVAVTFPANPKGHNVLLENARLQAIESQTVPMGKTGWVGYRTKNDLDVVCGSNEESFLDLVKWAVHDAVPELRGEKTDKVIPRQVFDVWHAAMSAVHSEGVRFTLQDIGKPIPFLTFLDKTGKEFAIDSRVPVQLSIDGEVALTCRRPADIKQFADAIRQHYFIAERDAEPVAATQTR